MKLMSPMLFLTQITTAQKCGIPNTDGSACFMNAGVQLVVNIPSLHEALMHIEPTSAVTSATHQMVAAYTDDCPNSQSFSEFHKTVRDEFGMYEFVGSSEKIPTQEDITEFLDRWLGVLGGPFLANMTFNIQSTLRRAGFPDSVSTESFTRLSVPLLPENDLGMANEPVGIDDLIKSSMRRTDVVYENKSYAKDIMIATLPDILFVSINRFLYHNGSAYYVYKPVLYSNTLIIKNVEYRLVGITTQKPLGQVVDGVSTSVSGHYVTVFADHADYGKANVYDDRTVTGGGNLLDHSKNVYVLVYIKADQVPSMFPKWKHVSHNPQRLEGLTKFRQSNNYIDGTTVMIIIVCLLAGAVFVVLAYITVRMLVHCERKSNKPSCLPPYTPPSDHETYL